MNCSYNCRQGRDCYQPWQCGIALHRVTPPLSSEDVTRAEYNEITMEDGPRDWVRAGLIAVVVMFVAVGLAAGAATVWHGF